MITLSFLLGRGPGWRRTVEEGKASIKVSSLEPRGPGRSACRATDPGLAMAQRIKGGR
jgi:hypothetical protein